MATTPDLNALYDSNPGFAAYVGMNPAITSRDTPLDQIPGLMRQAYDQWMSDAISQRGAAMATGRYGTAGPVSQFTSNQPWSDLGYSNPGLRLGEVWAYPGQEEEFKAFQEKYPGYAQISGLAMGPGAGTTSTMRQYVQDPSSVIHDPVYGDIAPVRGTGIAGKDPVPFMKAGGAVLAAMAAAAGGSALAGLGAEGGAAGGALSEVPNSLQLGSMGENVLGSAASGAAANIPGTAAFNATMGGLVPEIGALGDAGYFAGAAMPAVAAGGSSILDQIPSWLKPNASSVAKNVVTQAAKSILGGGGAAGAGGKSGGSSGANGSGSGAGGGNGMLNTLLSGLMLREMRDKKNEPDGYVPSTVDYGKKITDWGDWLTTGKMPQ